LTICTEAPFRLDREGAPMIKRTIEISAAPAHLTTRNHQLVLQRDGETIGSFPCEDLGMVVVDHPGTTFSHAALASLMKSDAVLVVCGRNHLPAGLLLPCAEHTQVVWRIHEQIRVKRPVRKRLWQQLIRAKILAQAGNLAADSAPFRRLRNLARDVRSGDPTNAEAQAAKIYWSSWLVNVDEPHDQSPSTFRRDQDGEGANALLNYGYAIVRAALARALVSAGLLPALGLKHANRSNAFCLADDLVEPLRPIVDHRVRELLWAGQTELDRATKAALLELLTAEVRTGNRTGPLMVAMHAFVSSLVSCYQGTSQTLEIPVRCRSADTVACGS
jgi:CRISPR-associated protein Cas1